MTINYATSNVWCSSVFTIFYQRILINIAPCTNATNSETILGYAQGNVRPNLYSFEIFLILSNLSALYVTEFISVTCYGSLIYNPLCNYRVSHLFDSFLPALATFTQDFAPKVIIFLVGLILRDFCFHLSLFRQIVATIVKFYIEII